MRWSKRWITIVATIATVQFIPSPAFAYSYDVQAGPLDFAGDGGYARGWGTVDFTAKKRFNYNTTIRDICDVYGDGDGIGASFYFALNIAGVTYTTNTKGADRDNCNNYTPGPYIDNVQWPNNIRGLNVGVAMDDNGNQIAVNASSYKPNPYV